MTLRLLAVHAHPDDESSKGAATYAYYRERGAEVMVVSCTGGERGDVLNEQLTERAMAERDMAGLRRLEMARARDILGIEHRWLGYCDSGLPDEGDPLPALCFAATPLEFSAAPLVRIIREFRPHVLVTYDENGGYPHPDHIRAHQVSMLAFAAAADSGQYPDLGQAWQVSKLYYDRIFNGARVRAVRDLMAAQHPDHSQLDSLNEISSWLGERPDSATTRVPSGQYFDLGDDALRAHASQVAPDDKFFFWPNEIQREAWPFEDFELVASTVPTTLPEDDLFSGITDEDDE